VSVKFTTVREAQAHGMVYQVRVEVRTRAAVAWVHACRALRWLVDERMAFAWAEAGSWRLARYRIDDGPWRRFERELP